MKWCRSVFVAFTATDSPCFVGKNGLNSHGVLHSIFLPPLMDIPVLWMHNIIQRWYQAGVFFLEAASSARALCTTMAERTKPGHQYAWSPHQAVTAKCSLRPSPQNQKVNRAEIANKLAKQPRLQVHLKAQAFHTKHEFVPCHIPEKRLKVIAHNPAWNTGLTLNFFLSNESKTHLENASDYPNEIK